MFCKYTVLLEWQSFFWKRKTNTDTAKSPTKWNSDVLAPRIPKSLIVPWSLAHSRLHCRRWLIQNTGWSWMKQSLTRAYRIIVTVSKILLTRHHQGRHLSHFHLLNYLTSCLPSDTSSPYELEAAITHWSRLWTRCRCVVRGGLPSYLERSITNSIDRNASEKPTNWGVFALSTERL